MKSLKAGTNSVESTLLLIFLYESWNFWNKCIICRMSNDSFQCHTFPDCTREWHAYALRGSLVCQIFSFHAYSLSVRKWFHMFWSTLNRIAVHFSLRSYHTNLTRTRIVTGIFVNNWNGPSLCVPTVLACLFHYGDDDDNGSGSNVVATAPTIQLDKTVNDTYDETVVFSFQCSRHMNENES